MKNTSPFSKFILFPALVIMFAGFIGCAKKEKPEPFREIVVGEAESPQAGIRDSIVNFANGLLGTPYVPAGCSADGFDCSGFVYYVFRNFEIDVPRSSAEFEHFGSDVPIEEVRRGDLLLFLSPTRDVIGHMGIVTRPDGMNSDFIHSTSGKQMSVVTTNLSKSGYKKRFVKAVRVLHER